MGKVYVLGGAQTDFERNWKKEGKNMVALLKEVVADGLADAEITLDDVRTLNKDNRVACFVGNFIAEKYTDQGHLGAFLTEVDPAFYGVPSARYEAACASSSVALDAAQSKIVSGEYDVAIVVGWELMKTVNSKVCGDILGRAAYYEKEGKNVSFPFPKLFGKLADETIIKYNLDQERYLDALAKISCINYSNAKRNPLAQTRKWFMDYKQARKRGTETNAQIGGLLGISDCSQVTDGSAVVVLGSERIAKKLGKDNAPVELRKNEADADLKRAKADIAELQLKEFRGEMHRSEDVEAAFEDFGMSVRSILLSLPGRLAVNCANAANAAEVSDIIKKEVNDSLNELKEYQYDPAFYAKRVREREGWVEEDAQARDS